MPESGLPGGGGATAFTGLSDTPLSYTGQAGKVLAVNPGETGVIFTTAGGSDGNGIYTGSGSLSANTTVTMGAFNLGFTGTGNVGIGTSTPLKKLDVVGGSIISTNTLLEGLILNEYSGTLPNALTFAQGGTANTIGATKFQLGVSNGNGQFMTGTVQGDAAIESSQKIFISAGGTTATMVLDNSTQNVGIGTSTPTEKLEVIGNANIQGDVIIPIANAFRIIGTTTYDFLKAGQNIGATDIMLGRNATGTNAGNGGFIAIGDGAASTESGIAIGTSSAISVGTFDGIAIGRSASVTAGARGIAIGRNATTSANDSFALGDNVAVTTANQYRYGVATTINVFDGSVGIGTTTPTEKLQITGNSYTTGQGSFGTAINPNAHLQVTASGKIVGIAGTSNAITANGSAAIRGTASSSAAVEIYGVDGSAQGTVAGTQNTAVRGNAITAGGSTNNYGGKFTGNNGSSQNIGIKATTGNGSTGTVIRGVFGESLHQGAADAYGGYFSATGTKTGENIGLFATATGATTNYAIKSDGNVNMANLPTSSAGLSAGDLWNNAGVINIV